MNLKKTMSPESVAKANGRLAVIACRVLEPELESIRQHHEQVEILYLDQGLHRTPQKMAAQVQALVD
jgi:hypothetical protein